MAIQFFGQFLLSQGLIDAAQLVRAVELQGQRNLRLGDYAVQRGSLTAEQVERVNRLQQSRDLRFGEAAVELGFMDEKAVESLLVAQRNDRVYLGQVVVDEGFATQQQVDEALEEFKREQAAYDATEVTLPESVEQPQHLAPYFDLTHKLMLRMLGLPNKMTPAYIMEGQLPLVGRGVRIPFFGELDVGYIVSAPERIVHRMATAMLGEDSQVEEELQDVVQEFANVVAGNVVARLAQLGLRIDIGPPEELVSPLALEGQKALFMAIATPEGDLIVALVY